eukprot:SAG11_NODE_411_length_9696_cov_46.841513_11_plen_252_part_00
MRKTVAAGSRSSGDEVAAMAVSLPVGRLVSMVFGSRSFSTQKKIALSVSDSEEWCCFSLITKIESSDFIADVAREARIAFMGAQLLRAGQRDPRAPIGVLLWHAARMRLHHMAVKGKCTLEQALAKVLAKAAADRHAAIEPLDLGGGVGGITPEPREELGRGAAPVSGKAQLLKQGAKHGLKPEAVELLVTGIGEPFRSAWTTGRATCNLRATLVFNAAPLHARLFSLPAPYVFSPPSFRVLNDGCCNLQP